MPGVARERCRNHPDREAAARCLGCGMFYCRECVTDHEGRMLCVSCLRKRPSVITGKARLLTGLAEKAAAVGAAGAAMLFFYVLGRLLIVIPAVVHEGRLTEYLGLR